MKIVKFIVLYFCLIGSSFAFSQAKYEDVCAQYERIKKNIERYDSIIAEKENSSKEEDIKNLEECKRVRNNLVEQIKKLEEKCATAQLAKELSQAYDEVNKQKREIDEVTKKFYAHKESFDEYLKFFKTLDTDDKVYAYQHFENEVEKQGKLVEAYNSDMTGLINILKYRVREKTGYTPNITSDNFMIRKDNPNYFSERINKNVNNSLSATTRQEIQQMFDKAANRYAEMKSKKEKASKEYEYNKWALGELLKECPQCHNKYEKTYNK